MIVGPVGMSVSRAAEVHSGCHLALSVHPGCGGLERHVLRRGLVLRLA